MDRNFVFGLVEVKIVKGQRPEKKSVDPNEMTIYVTDNNIHIVNSYLIKKRSDMQLVLTYLRCMYHENKVLKHRSNESMLNEWCSHNLLYNLNIQRDRTADVDLDYPQKLVYKIAYWILAKLYRY